MTKNERLIEENLRIKRHAQEVKAEAEKATVYSQNTQKGIQKMKEKLVAAIAKEQAAVQTKEKVLEELAKLREEINQVKKASDTVRRKNRELFEYKNKFLDLANPEMLSVVNIKDSVSMDPLDKIDSLFSNCMYLNQKKNSYQTQYERQKAEINSLREKLEIKEAKYQKLSHSIELVKKDRDDYARMNKDLREKLKQIKIRYRDLVLCSNNTANNTNIVNKNGQQGIANQNTSTMEYAASLQQPINSSSSNNELDMLENGFKGISKGKNGHEIENEREIENEKFDDDLNFNYDSIHSLYKPVKQSQNTSQNQQNEKKGHISMEQINRKISKLKKKQKQKKNVKTGGVDNSSLSLIQRLNTRLKQQEKRDSDSLFDVNRLEKGKSNIVKSQQQKVEQEKQFMMKFLKKTA